MGRIWCTMVVAVRLVATGPKEALARLEKDNYSEAWPSP